jgi:K(+)-stimulated pyrophosphate-energized sodium pump
VNYQRRPSTDILDSEVIRLQQLERFCYRFSSVNFISLFAAYVTFTGIDGINIFKAPVLAMFLLVE